MQLPRSIATVIFCLQIYLLPVQWASRTLTPGVKWLGLEVYHSAPSSAELKSGGKPPLPHTPYCVVLCKYHGQLCLTSFTDKQTYPKA